VWNAGPPCTKASPTLRLLAFGSARLVVSPLGIKTTLESAHLSIDESEAAAFAKLNEQFGALFHSQDFVEGRKAEAEGRPPVYQGK
jgi:hypothetical protein